MPASQISLASPPELFSTDDSSKLICIPSRRKNPRLRLFCFPYAGGGIATFNPWNQLLPAEIEVAIITLPGRGSRLIEPAYSSMAEIVENLFKAFQNEQPSIPCLFFGHSMGARIAYELMAKMQAHNHPLPKHFFASGSIAPTRLRKKKSIHHLSDEALIRKLGKMNPGSREVLANKELASMLLPSLRADFRIVETYQCLHATQLACSVSVFAGKRDDEAKAAEILPWHALFSSHTTPHWFEGNHFFVDSHRVSVTKEIVRILESLSLIP